MCDTTSELKIPATPADCGDIVVSLRIFCYALISIIARTRSPVRKVLGSIHASSIYGWLLPVYQAVNGCLLYIRSKVRLSKELATPFHNYVAQDGTSLERCFKILILSMGLSLNFLVFNVLFGKTRAMILFALDIVVYLSSSFKFLFLVKWCCKLELHHLKYCHQLCPSLQINFLTGVFSSKSRQNPPFI